MGDVRGGIDVAFGDDEPIRIIDNLFNIEEDASRFLSGLHPMRAHQPKE
jgi:hypothetical protein